MDSRRWAVRLDGVRLSDQERALAESCYRLAWLTAMQAWNGSKRLQRCLPNAEDAVGIAMLGLCHAAQCYRPESGYQFTTYAVAAIYQFLAREAATTGPTITVPVKSKYAADKRRALRIGTLSVDLPRETDESPVELDKAMKCLSRQDRSLLCRLYGIGNRKPQKPSEIAKRWHVTPFIVRYRRDKALRRLRAEVEAAL